MYNAFYLYFSYKVNNFFFLCHFMKDYEYKFNIDIHTVYLALAFLIYVVCIKKLRFKSL